MRGGGSGDFLPDCGTKIPQAAQCSQKKKKSGPSDHSYLLEFLVIYFNFFNMSTSIVSLSENSKL